MNTQAKSSQSEPAAHHQLEPTICSNTKYYAAPPPQPQSTSNDELIQSSSASPTLQSRKRLFLRRVHTASHPFPWPAPKCPNVPMLQDAEGCLAPGGIEEVDGVFQSTMVREGGEFWLGGMAWRKVAGLGGEGAVGDEGGSQEGKGM